MEWPAQRSAMAMLTIPNKLARVFVQMLSSNLVDQSAQNHKNLEITVRFTGSIAVQTFQLAKNID
jgi:hypothetical protein